MILIVDCGSQFSQLISQKIRKQKIYSKIVPQNVSTKKIREIKPNGIIISGSPLKISTKNINFNFEILKLGIPVLGICYGMHLIVYFFKGRIKNHYKKEYGSTSITLKSYSKLFVDVKKNINVWMSHSDSIEYISNNFEINGFSENEKIAAISDSEKNIYGVQFHPEVDHTECGEKIIKNFLFRICKCFRNWSMSSFINNSVKNICDTVGSKKVMLALSGGIDSLVTGLLLERAINNQLICVFVDNGLMRENEESELLDVFYKYLKCNIIVLKKKKLFLNSLSKVKNPEIKRKIIGELFIKVFEEEAEKHKNLGYLAQGTLYSDVVESVPTYGNSASVIKSHHNVGGLPKLKKFKLIEPLRNLFKDEVREIALKMKMSKNIIWKHPFPGPGLAIRILGEVNKNRLEILRKADKILIDEVKSYDCYYDLWQSFAALLPLKSVGVMGEKRTYEYIIAIRAVTSKNAMTADWARLPYGLLKKISNRITNEVDGVNRVMYDISSKPPSTIEFE